MVDGEHPAKEVPTCPAEWMSEIAAPSMVDFSHPWGIVGASAGIKTRVNSKVNSKVNISYLPCCRLLKMTKLSLA